MCKRAFSAWFQLIQFCIHIKDNDKYDTYDGSSENQVFKTTSAVSSGRYNLRARKNVKYTDDSDDDVSSRISSRDSRISSRDSRISSRDSRISSRDADSREASSNDD